MLKSCKYCGRVHDSRFDCGRRPRFARARRTAEHEFRSKKIWTDKSLDIEVNFQDEPCFVHADADQIQQVVINLLDNAIKYTPAHGTITLTTKAVDDHVVMRVKDNGIGIPASDEPYIFDRFYKVDKAHTVGKGTGLGLAICKRIMERHGQQIRLVSGDGGAEFEITLEKGNDPGGFHGNTGTGEN